MRRGDRRGIMEILEASLTGSLSDAVELVGRVFA